MKIRKALRAVSVAAMMLLVASLAHAGVNAVCPPLNPNAGVTSSTQPPIPNVSPAGCDWGFTVGTASVVLQGPALRHFYKITNTDPTGSIGVCFSRLELNLTCTMANAGTVLAPGQSMYMGVAMYGGINSFNSMFFNNSIELIGSASSVAVSISIE